MTDYFGAYSVWGPGPRVPPWNRRGRTDGAALLLAESFQQPLAFLTALRAEAGGRRYLELPYPKGALPNRFDARFLHPDDDKAGRA